MEYQAKLDGIGGWLRFYQIYLLWGIVGLAFGFPQTYKQWAPDSFEWNIFLVVSLGLFIACIVALYSITARKAWAVTFNVRMNGAMILLAVARGFWIGGAEILLAMIAPVIWLFYFRESKRVYSTFKANPDEKAIAGLV